MNFYVYIVCISITLYIEIYIYPCGSMCVCMCITNCFKKKDLVLSFLREPKLITLLHNCAVLHCGSFHPHCITFFCRNTY